MKKIRTAVIGINEHSHSKQIIGSVRKQTDLFEVVGYHLPENERERIPKRIPNLDGLREMSLSDILDDPAIEAVVVETDEIYLTKYALLAAKAGKHIHMEKPGSVSLSGYKELIAEVKKSGKVFHTGYMYRYNPFIMDALEQVKSGKLGEIISVEAQMNCWHPEKTRQWLETFPGGMMFYLGCHLVDLIYRIQGMPERVIPLNKRSGLDGVTGEDFGMAIFEYKNGVSFAKTTAVERGGFARRQLVINGSEGTIELCPLEWYLPGQDLMQTFRTVRTETGWHVKVDPEASEGVDRYDGMMAAFAKYVRGEAVNPYTPDYELELYKLLLQACGVKVNE